MRCYGEPIEVETDAGQLPVNLCWRRRAFEVLGVRERWRWAGKWWLTGMPQRRYYFRLEILPVSRYPQSYRSRLIEIYRQDNKWILSRVCD